MTQQDKAAGAMGEELPPQLEADMLDAAKAAGFKTTCILSRGPELIGGSVELHQRVMNYGRACMALRQPAAEKAGDLNVKQYKVMIERNGETIQAGVVSMIGTKGWQYTPFYQESPSRKYHATADDAVKSRLLDYALKASK